MISSKIPHRSLSLGNDLRFEFTVAVPRCFDRYLAKVAPHGFGGRPVAGVAAAAALRRVRRIAQMFFHLQLEESFQGLFHQTLDNGF